MHLPVTNWKIHRLPRPAILYFVCALLVLLFHGIVFTAIGPASFGIAVHDTYVVVAYPVILFTTVLLFLFFAVTAYFLAKISDRSGNRNIYYGHCLISLICLLVLLWPHEYAGMAGLPRRYFGHSTFRALNYVLFVQHAQRAIFVTFVGAQLLFVGNVLFALFGTDDHRTHLK